MVSDGNTGLTEVVPCFFFMFSFFKFNMILNVAFLHVDVSVVPYKAPNFRYDINDVIVL